MLPFVLNNEMTDIFQQMYEIQVFTQKQIELSKVFELSKKV